MNLFQQAWQGANLTPGQRATLKAVKGIFYSAILAALAATAQFFAANGNIAKINWLLFGTFVLGAVLVSLGLTLDKFLSANGEAPIGALVDTTLQGFASDLEGRMGTPDVAPPTGGSVIMPVPIGASATNAIPAPVAVSIDTTVTAEGTP